MVSLHETKLCLWDMRKLSAPVVDHCLASTSNCTNILWHDKNAPVCHGLSDALFYWNLEDNEILSKNLVSNIALVRQNVKIHDLIYRTIVRQYCCYLFRQRRNDFYRSVQYDNQVVFPS